MAMIKFELFFDEDNSKFVAVNPETGEVKELTEKKVRKTTKKIVDDNPNPEITLEENKYIFNQAAVTLLGIEPDDKIVIRYIHGEPVIAKNSVFGVESGNRLTKSYSVSCRGKANDELSKFGNKFTLTPAEKEGSFVMNGNKPQLPKETEEISNPDDIDDLDSLIDEMIDDTEVSNFNFKL